MATCLFLNGMCRQNMKKKKISTYNKQQSKQANK